MGYECILYGSRAIMLGLPIASFVAYLVYRFILVGFDTKFLLPYHAMIIASFSVFIVVFISMMYAIMKIKKENIMDVLKNENI